MQLRHSQNSVIIYFKILPQQNFKQIFSKLTHSPKCQNDVLHDDKLIWMPPIQGYIYIGICLYCKTKLGRVSMEHGDESVSKIEKQL